MAKEQERCGNCRFMCHDGKHPSCHKKSPGVFEGCRVQLGRESPALNQLTAHTYVAQWPIIDLSGWCGDYGRDS